MISTSLPDSSADNKQQLVPQIVHLNGEQTGPRFDGIGIVNGGGATSVLLKDYPEAQRSQILDLVFKPKFGASVSALLVEIPGDGNATQGSMLSHMHTRDDLNYSRGYTWWILSEAKKRNPNLTLDGTAWSAPGWIGQEPATRFDNEHGDAAFWSQDTVEYYLAWLRGLREEYGLEMEAIGCRNEKGYSFGFVKALRQALNKSGFQNVKIHAFDNWPEWKFDFVKELLADPELCNSIDILGAHVMYAKDAVSPKLQEVAAQLVKPIWNTEDHVYKKGFDCQISVVECFNDNFIQSGATKIINWYDIAGVYPLEPYSEDPAMIVAHSPWSGHYKVREALWGYAHYGQFTEVGWHYLNGGCVTLEDDGSIVTLKSPTNDYSVIIETKDAQSTQQIQFKVEGGLSGQSLCVWRSNEREQFVRQTDITLVDGGFTLTIEPNSIYSLSTTRGQQKGTFTEVPASKPFPFPYIENFKGYKSPEKWGYLTRYFADIAGAFELVERPDKSGICLRQVVPIPTISWAPDWRPFTIFGDENWGDYEVGADVYLTPDDTAGVMGRINHVGTGYGFEPKGYFLEISSAGDCRLVVMRGKKDKTKLTGDAEQQARIRAQNDLSEGGEKVLASVKLPHIAVRQWHNLKLKFSGSAIAALVDGEPVLSVIDTLYETGMTGLIVGQNTTKISTPYFDNVVVNTLDGPVRPYMEALPSQAPLYPTSQKSEL
jgi:galactosylceramidase